MSPAKVIPLYRYTASEAFAIARGYWPGSSVFVGLNADGTRSVGFRTDTGEVAAEFHGDTFNAALTLAEPHRFPLEDWIAGA